MILFNQILRTIGLVSITSPTSFTILNHNDSQSEILLDYGLAVGGLPYFNITNPSSPQLDNISFQVVLSETLNEVEFPYGDGPFYLFSNAMNTYRNNTYTVSTSAGHQYLEGRFLQASQRYLRLRLLTPDSSISFSGVGFKPVREATKPIASFSCSNDRLNEIWKQGARTVDKCTVHAQETIPAWNVHDEGTRIYGQHWAPCRFGTRWSNYTTKFSVRIEAGGASWGVRMVVNGLIFLLDVDNKELRAYEGLSDESSVFPSIPKGAWPVHHGLKLGDWMEITTIASGSMVSVYLGDSDEPIAEVSDVNIVPTLGGAPNNTGSIAFGVPNGWTFSIRSLLVESSDGEDLYQNSFLPHDAARVLSDFAVGTNALANTIDGAKRDRATFGGDLHILGRSIAYSTQVFEAVKGSILLLTSHQTSTGYLGNLSPIQAPVWNASTDGEPATYAFYSLTYASLLIVAIKDYWMHSGDDDMVDPVLLERLRKQMGFTESYVNSNGLIEAPPELSLTFFPLGGPVVGASTQLNLAYYDALQSMALLTTNNSEASQLESRAAMLKKNIVARLWDPDSGTLRLGQDFPAEGFAQDANSHGISLGVSPSHMSQIPTLSQPGLLLPNAFVNLTGWSEHKLCSPYATAFTLEALFSLSAGRSAIDLMERIWGKMSDSSNPDYSGGHWEAMTLEGDPYQNSTSLVHGWSTSPVYLLPKYLAGLRPTKPGWKVWEARPVWAGIKNINASIPTPYGVIVISWTFGEEDAVGHVEWVVPKDTTGTVYPPTGWLIAQDDNESKFGTAGVVCKSSGRHRRSLLRP